MVGLVLDPGPRLLGWILGGTSTAWLDLDSLAGPELVSRIDVIGLFLDPELELMCSSRTDVVGLVLDPGPSWQDLQLLGWTPTAWLDSDSLAGTGTGESD